MLAEAQHGFFSYYLMKGMEGDADGDKNKRITAGELHQYALANGSWLQRNQTPDLQGDTKRVLVRWCAKSPANPVFAGDIRTDYNSAS